MKQIVLNENLENKYEMLKDLLQQITGMEFQKEEDFIEFLIDGYLNSLQPHGHGHGDGGCCGGSCGCSH